MTTTEISGVAHMGGWSTLPGGFEVFVELTSKPNRVYIRIRPKLERASRIKHRRHGEVSLTEPPGSGKHD